MTRRGQHLGWDLVVLQKVKVQPDFFHNLETLFKSNICTKLYCQGFCGNTRNHCKCKTCIDYSKVKPATTKAPPPAPRASVKRAEEEVTEGPEVKVAQGQLKGRTVSGGEEVGSWHEFWSVPYAQPPTGSLRFKRPEVAEPWDNLRDATSQPPPCPQRLSAGPKTGEVSS